VIDPLIGARSIHFATTAIVAGTAFFGLFVSSPVFRQAGAGVHPEIAAYHRSIRQVAAAALVIAVLSGAAWLLLLAVEIGNQFASEGITIGLVLTLLTKTQIGFDWIVRLILAALLSMLLMSGGDEPGPLRWRAAALALIAAAFIGGLAWAGHSGAAPGVAGNIQIAADVFHLIAAGAWIGGLVPFAMLMALAFQTANQTTILVARDATLRFSMLGIASVGMLLVTGIVNSWMLIGDLSNLIGNRYGQLLLIKAALFLIMIVVAAINRSVLTPKLVAGSKTTQTSAACAAVQQLQRNSLIEIGLGFAIIAIVGVLGTLPPHGKHEFTSGTPISEGQSGQMHLH
jgi:putative copper resistance protein D